MALPIKQAGDLAKAMASKGLSGSISMSKPTDKGPMDDEEMGDSEDKQEEYGEEQCLDQVSDALMSGDKDQIKAGLKQLLEFIEESDHEDDGESGPELGE